METIEKMMSEVVYPVVLLNCDLTKANKELLAATVINQLNTPTYSPLERYARARFLLGALETVCKEVGAAAEAYCEKENIGADGKQFEHNGLCFMRKFNITYNYAANDDVAGFEGRYRDACVEERLAAHAAKEAKVKREGIETLIELAHPNMQPIVDRVTIQFHMEDK